MYQIAKPSSFINNSEKTTLRGDNRVLRGIQIGSSTRLRSIYVRTNRDLTPMQHELFEGNRLDLNTNTSNDFSVIRRNKLI